MIKRFAPSRRGLDVLCLTILTAACLADEGDDAVAQLNSAYKNCLNAYPANAREQLRVAQRAWITFSNKNEAAAELAGKRRGVSTEDLDREGITEVMARTEQLKTYFVPPSEDVQSCKRDLQLAEQELTATYQQSLQNLASDEQQKLREAQRSWIEFRDKDARARIEDPTGRAAVWAAVVLARRRAQELRDFYVNRLANTASVVYPHATVAEHAVNRDSKKGNELPDVEALHGYGKCPWGASVQTVIRSNAINAGEGPRPLGEEEIETLKHELGLKINPDASILQHTEEDKKWTYVFFGNELAIVIYQPPEAVGSDGNSLLSALEQKYGKLKTEKIDATLEQKYAAAGANITGSQLGVSVDFENLCFSTENDFGGIKAFGVKTQYSKYAGLDLGKAIQNKIQEAVEGAKTTLNINQIVYYSGKDQKRAGEAEIQLEEEKKRAAEEAKKKKIDSIRDDL